MRSVFGDESQDESKQRVFSVAGIFGSSDEWDSFAGEWMRRTGGRIFHAADCESDQGEFSKTEHISKTEHKDNQELYKDLTVLLTKTKFMGYAASIDLTAYREFFPRATDPNDPYYFCFYAVIEKFSELNFHCIPLDKVEFTFDQNWKVQHNASELYQCMRSLPEWKGYDLLSDKVSYTTRDNPRIQAADLFAREGMKRLDHRIGPVRRIRRSLLALEGTKRFAFFELGREYFRSLIEKANLLRDLPSADMIKYREWLEKNGICDNTSNRIRYHNHMLEKLQRPAQRE